MLKIQKYILGLLIGPFLAITIGLSLLALITQSLTQLDLIVERGQSPFTILFDISVPELLYQQIVMAMKSENILFNCFHR